MLQALLVKSQHRRMATLKGRLIRWQQTVNGGPGLGLLSTRLSLIRTFSCEMPDIGPALLIRMPTDMVLVLQQSSDDINLDNDI